MAIQDILENYATQGLSNDDYLARLAEAEACFDHLAYALIASGDIIWDGGSQGRQIFCPIDLGKWALQGQDVRVVAQPTRRTIHRRITTPDREHRSIALKIPDNPAWVAGDREYLNTYNSRQIKCVSINSAFQTASPRSIGRLEAFRSVLDEVLTFL